MLFNSYIFILLFFPLCMAGYFGLNRLGKYQTAQAFLLVMSLWFYGYFNPSYLLIILASIGINFLFTKLLHRTEKTLLRKLLLLASLLFNLGILFYFKYYNFFVQNVNALFHLSWTTRNILLPLGISFFTFQQISYVVDVYRGQVKEYPFLHYACFVSYFPQLIAGPIVTHDELIPQFLDASKKKFNWDNFSRGLFLFALGLAKKVLIADTFGNAANPGFANPFSLDTTNALLTSFAYTIQIYFDFSGYCDMAMGIGQMMNIDLPLNFNSPYKALTITEFWDRWHMTLTRFLTRYIYIPLGGNRKGAFRTYLNILMVFLVSGLWHGANWTFILWGGLHGLFSVFTRWQEKNIRKLPKVLNWTITFAFLNLTWILFRANTLLDAAYMIFQLFTGNFGPVSEALSTAFLLPELEFLAKALPFCDFLRTSPALLTAAAYGLAMCLLLCFKNAPERMCTFKPSWKNALATYILLVWCILSLSGVSTFLYFNF